MNNYECLIMESIDGNTPKEKYDALIQLRNSKLEMEARIQHYKLIFDSLRETRDDTTVGNIKSFLPL